MFQTIRIAAGAAAMALLVATAAQASTPKDTSSWVNAQVNAPPNADKYGTSAVYTSRAGDRGQAAFVVLASRAGANGHGATEPTT